MAKSKTDFDLGKILLWAEKGLESLFIVLENATEKKLKSVLRINKKFEKQKIKQYQKFDFDNTRLEKDIDKDLLGQERMQELSELEKDETHDVETDRE